MDDRGHVAEELGSLFAEVELLGVRRWGVNYLPKTLPFKHFDSRTWGIGRESEKWRFCNVPKERKMPRFLE